MHEIDTQNKELIVRKKLPHSSKRRFAFADTILGMMTTNKLFTQKQVAKRRWKAPSKMFMTPTCTCFQMRKINSPRKHCESFFTF